LLSHNPDVAEDPILLASRLRVDLMISGHTHGGQVRLPLLGTPIVPSRFGSRYAGGFVKGPAFPVIISRGIGMSLLPVRWNVAPEIVEIELVGV
jgi:predicted MPP superfamily phosphohydrolase